MYLQDMKVTFFNHKNTGKMAFPRTLCKQVMYWTAFAM